jgi:alanine racemase
MVTSYPSTAVVDLAAYAHNLRVIRQMLPKECGIMAVVKADAYGHGAVPVAQRAISEGMEMLGVASVSEAVELREAGISAPIVVLVQPSGADRPAVVEHDLRVVLSDVAVAERIGELARRANKVIPVHCKIDTGMGRQGLRPEETVEAILRLTRVSHVDVEGVSTHFCVADQARDPFTTQQIRQFKHVLRQLEKEGIPFELVHAANSAAIVNFRASTFDMVRPGLMTYGVWPTDAPPKPSPLQPALRWETSVALLKDLEPESTVGYGRTFVAKRHMRTAVLPVGYADGYKFRLGNNADVLIRGKRCPVLGRISMDQTVVDVTHIPAVSQGDTATLIGTDSNETITATELAQRAGTIPYDILTGIGTRVHRTYVD